MSDLLSMSLGCPLKPMPSSHVTVKEVPSFFFTSFLHPHFLSPMHTQRHSHPALNPGISASVSLLLLTPLVQTVITAHLDPVSSPSSSLYGFPLIYRTQIIKNHLPPVSLRSHCSPPHMPVKAPSCLSNHNKTLPFSEFKAHYQLALLYLTAVHSCPAQVGPPRSSQAKPFHLRCHPEVPEDDHVCTHLQECAYAWWGAGWGSLQGREEERKEITTPFIFCSREILKHEHQG